MPADLVIRGGTVVDGTGRPSYETDVAISGQTIAEVGTGLSRGREEIDARGLLVTPGFVDPHTHFDGQATWDPLLAPSSQHGVTSAVMGNCGVGFAPVEEDRHDWLIATMEGVEDIPGTALAEGLRWGWRSFSEYLDALEGQPRVIDIGAQVPHAALRGFVMGDRGADAACHPDQEELSMMASLVTEAIEAGALGLSTSRSELHRTSRGDTLGTLRAEQRELLALAGAVAATGRGVIQLLSDAYRSSDEDFARSELELIGALARTGRPVSFTVQQSHQIPDRWRWLMEAAERLSGQGLDVKAQVAPRPIGLLLGLEASTNPFSMCRPYQRVAGLPHEERLKALEDPDLRASILRSHAALARAPASMAGLRVLTAFENMYVLDDPVDYRLTGLGSVADQAAARGLDVTEHAYDLLVGHGGRQLLYVPVFNFADRSLDAVGQMLSSPAAMFGLSDAGAHCGQICDASMTTSFLTVWARDSAEVPLERVVHHLTARPAAHVGWLDRGVIAPGYLADLNVLDLGALACRPPRVVADLPAGGRRLVQESVGYRCTVKSGAVTFRDGEATGERPGVLVRGPQPAPPA